MKNNKQYGVWMDTHEATIAGRENIDNGDFQIIGTIKNPGASNNSNEHASNQHEIGLTQKYFKDIALKMANIDEILVTGTGQVQEQFIKYLSETPQYKNATCTESTSNRMSDEQLLDLITKHFN
jgi:stalled ribosome rescue protein Dom34